MEEKGRNIVNTKSEGRNNGPKRGRRIGKRGGRREEGEEGEVGE